MLRIIHGSLLDIHTEAIVNPVNEELVTGGGVDRAVCRAAGPGIEDAKRGVGFCPVGNAVATPGFSIVVKYRYSYSMRTEYRAKVMVPSIVFFDSDLN